MSYGLAFQAKIWLSVFQRFRLRHAYRNFAPAIVSIHPKRAAARSSRMPGANRRRVVSFARVFVTGVALSLALSGCGVFCNIGGGSGGVGGSCAIGTGFRF
ncbi:hypothetical protein SAMN05192544_102119 [Paraburkholderia hospita]|uniref:Uncharacterized protein n=1 Tax=Paraburkholderia hospita TaxID=169430 RepID=A0AAN1J6G6_9BURK|nr:hypothetical protein C2L64_06780 [Paraburkholderia hospita]SEI10275.1 hypothetical protein SAMN05192544_102119 [Paraburkholderia hospita]